MPHRRFPHPPMAGVLFAILAAGLPAQSWLPSSPYPTWSSVQPLRTLRVDYDSGKTSSENGEVLHTAMLSLQPGDELKVGSGTYTIDARLELTLQGTATAPIWITAANLGSRPVVTRSDAKQNALNLGSFTTAVKYLCLRGLEITNGSELVRILLAEQLWMDKCYIHDGNGTGIAANTVDISYLYLTENEIARPGPGQTGEGIGDRRAVGLRRGRVARRGIGLGAAAGAQAARLHLCAVGDRDSVRRDRIRHDLASGRLYARDIHFQRLALGGVEPDDADRLRIADRARLRSRIDAHVDQPDVTIDHGGGQAAALNGHNRVVRR